jgi:hypothetical protein
MLHVEIASGFEPALVGLGGEGADETQAARGIGKDPDNQGAALQFLSTGTEVSLIVGA